MSTLYYESSIAHHGVKGQRWGVIRKSKLTAESKKKAKNTEKVEKQYELGKKLHDTGLARNDIQRIHHLRNENVKLGASVVKSLIFGTGLGFTPVGGLSLAFISAGQIAYNLSQNKRQVNQIKALEVYKNRSRSR